MLSNLEMENWKDNFKMVSPRLSQDSPGFGRDDSHKIFPSP